MDQNHGSKGLGEQMNLVSLVKPKIEHLSHADFSRKGTFQFKFHIALISSWFWFQKEAI